MDLSEQREKDLYAIYQEVVSRLIVELETRDTEYPVEILNEIRATFTHLSRFRLQGRESELSKAEGHMKRATLDCFKYMCISYAEELQQFRHTYRKVNLGLADNGKFLPELDQREHKARELYIDAKSEEIKAEISTDDLYGKYELAYNAYKDISRFLNESQGAITFASQHSKRSNRINIFSIAVTLISIVITIWALLT